MHCLYEKCYHRCDYCGFGVGLICSRSRCKVEPFLYQLGMIDISLFLFDSIFGRIDITGGLSVPGVSFGNIKRHSKSCGHARCYLGQCWFGQGSKRLLSRRRDWPIWRCHCLRAGGAPVFCSARSWRFGRLIKIAVWPSRRSRGRRIGWNAGTSLAPR